MVGETETTPIWKSQRGVILIIGMVLFTIIILAGGMGLKIDATATGVLGGLIMTGGAFFFKDKATEAIDKLNS